MWLSVIYLVCASARRRPCRCPLLCRAVVLQVVINCGALQCLLSLLTANHKKSIKKEACWTISNITAGTKEQIQAVIDNSLIPPLVHLLGVSVLVMCMWWRGMCHRNYYQATLIWTGKRCDVV